jgi:hypothetical protein
MPITQQTLTINMQFSTTNRAKQTYIPPTFREELLPLFGKHPEEKAIKSSRKPACFQKAELLEHLFPNSNNLPNINATFRYRINNSILANLNSQHMEKTFRQRQT